MRKLTDEELIKVVGGLPNKQQRRIEMRYLENLTISKIAKIEKCGENKVQNSISIALKKIKNSLKRLFLFMFLICVLFTMILMNYCAKQKLF